MNEDAVKDLDPELIKIIDAMPPDRRVLSLGAAGTDSPQIRPTYLRGDQDTVVGDEMKSNATIVLGVDRPGCRFDGYGGKGYTQCAAIDIVVGRMSYQPKSVFVNPSFKHDAARIYLSQKTDIDKNCNLPPTNVGQSVGRSAIALLADGIRIVSREGIKICSDQHSKNSQGGEIESISGVAIVAGNDAEGEQPIPKGSFLADALGRLAVHIMALNGIVDHLLTTQMNFNESLTHHFHYSPFYGSPTTPSDSVVGKGIKTSIDFLQDTKRSLLTNKTNLVNFKQTYLEPSGCKYINSRWNSVN